MAKILKSSNKQGFGRIFSNPKVKMEMLSLRLAGYSYHQIALKYGVDHTTIVHHCKNAGLTIGGVRERRRMQELFAVKEMSNEDIAMVTGVDIAMVALNRSNWKSQNGSKKKNKQQKVLPKLTINKSMVWAEHETNTHLRDRIIKIDKRGVEWRKDEQGEWICLGRSEATERKDRDEKKKKALEEKRLSMLSY
jgi:hypothetical protein